MSEPYIQIFDGVMGTDLKIATIVLDKADYDVLIDEIAKNGVINMKHGTRAGEHVATSNPITGQDKTDIDILKVEGCIPLVKRGTKTEFIFKKYKLPDEVKNCSVMVRGRGPNVLKKFVDQLNAHERN